MEVEAAVQAAKAAFPGWAATPVLKRVQILYRVRELILEHMDELTYLVAEENGKCWKEAEGDVLKAKEGTEQAISVSPAGREPDGRFQRLRQRTLSRAARCVRRDCPVQFSVYDPDGLDDAHVHCLRQYNCN